MHTIIIRDKDFAACILERLRCLRGLNPRLTMDGSRYVITYWEA